MSDSMASAQDEYVVVARRYRPQTFDELIGQGHVAQALKQAITTGRVGHAYLFTGARGVGKTSAARILAKALNCMQGPTPTPCNACDVCQSVSTGDDVDVLEIDGASNRGIDEIRQLRQNVAVRPSRARFKVYIIDEVHMLTKEAFNALLKTLEEPPEHVKFIFATTEPNKIPITILSRCQRFDFAGIEATAIQTRLAQIAESEGVGIDAEALQILAMRAAGSMRDSQSLLEQLLAIAEGAITGADVNQLLGIAPAQRVSDLARCLADRDAAAALSELHHALAGGADVGQLLDQLLGYFRDAMAVAVGAGMDAALYALPSQGEEVKSLAEALGPHTLLAALQVLDETAARLRLSVHSRTLAEMAIVRICSLEDLDDLARLVATLRDGSGPAAAAPPSRPAARSGSATPSSSRQPPPPQAPPAGAQAVEQHTPATVESPPAASLPKKIEASATPEGETPDSNPVVSGSSTQEHTEPIAQEQLSRCWKSMAEQVGGLLGSVASMAVSVHPIDGARVRVRFDKPVNRDTCEQPLHKQQLEQTLAACTGRRLLLEFEAVASTTGPAAPKVSRRQRQAEVAQRPFVQAAMEMFEAQQDKLRYIPPASES